MLIRVSGRRTRTGIIEASLSSRPRRLNNRDSDFNYADAIFEGFMASIRTNFFGPKSLFTSLPNPRTSI